jgi:preprotein translocase subunit SecF
MASLVKFGNDLYTGERSFGFVRRRTLWYAIAGVLIVISVLVPILRGGFVFGIEFSGGSEFQVAGAGSEQQPAMDAVVEVVPDAAPRVSTIGADAIRVQTEELTSEESTAVRNALAATYNVPVDDIAVSLVGPTWGADITASSIRAVIVFIVLSAIFMAIYFRNWKMSLAAIATLAHDIIITVGVYGVFGFEITPAAVIGFLTILGYSLYDTVVVFDKVRENVEEDSGDSVRTFAESVNLGVNQTLVRSINTGVVAALPVASILFIGAYVLGAVTLRDIALALFIGILVGTYSTIFIAAPLYSQLRENEPEIAANTKRKLAQREKAAVTA